MLHLQNLHNARQNKIKFIPVHCITPAWYQSSDTRSQDVVQENAPTVWLIQLGIDEIRCNCLGDGGTGFVFGTGTISAFFQHGAKLLSFSKLFV